MTVQYVADCPCGLLAVWTGVPAESGGGTTYRVDCPSCDALLLRGGAAVVPDNQGEEAA